MHIQITDYAGVRIFRVSNVHTVVVQQLGLCLAGHYTQVSTFLNVWINRFYSTPFYNHETI